MRCKSCNAPLPSGKIYCPYCGVANELDLSVVHAYTVTKPESERKCPVCRIAMQTIDLEPKGAHFYIERCTRCYGLFFDPNELTALLSKTVQDIAFIDYKKLETISQQRADNGIKRPAYIRCPICDKMMTRRNFGARSGVVVDRCKEHGVWLDGGELFQLMQWRKAGGAVLDEQRSQEQGHSSQSHAAISNKKTSSVGALPGVPGSREDVGDAVVDKLLGWAFRMFFR